MNDQELTHYASKYYDPEKAHEYYMKNRQLKGRTTSGLSDEGKNIWAVTKDNITSSKKREIEATKLQKEQEIESLRSKAKATRKSISDKLKRLSIMLADKYKSENTKLSNQIAAINDNSGLTATQKEVKKSKLYGDRKRLSSDKQEELGKSRTNIESERADIAVDLKAAVKKARDTFATTKESINSDYEKTYQKEYDNIKAQYKKQPKPKAAKKGKKGKKGRTPIDYRSPKNRT